MELPSTSTTPAAPAGEAAQTGKRSEVTPQPTPSAESSTFGLRRGDQLFVGVCVIVGLVLLLIQAARLSGWGRPAIEIERLPARKYDYQLDVNRATWVEWTLLEGIGETLAKRIVADREERGPFKAIEDVRRVRGIGPKTWEQIQPWLTIGSGASDTTQ